MQSIVALALGLYLQSNNLLKDAQGKIDPIKHPMIWQKSIKSLGLGLIGFGVWRVYEVYRISKDQFATPHS